MQIKTHLYTFYISFQVESRNKCGPLISTYIYTSIISYIIVEF